jgi:hypothetical protein
VGSVPFVVSVLWIPSALCGAGPVITGHSVSSLSLRLVWASCLLCCFCVSTLVVPPKSCLQAFRLLFIPSGCSAVMRVKVDFLGDRKASAELSLGDLTFIIEEPRPSFFTPACKHKDSPLSVYWERWKHIQCFHFVYASPRQAALYSRLDVPHYSESAVKMKSAIAEFLQAHPGQDCISHYHLPHINSITPFLLVFNHLPLIQYLQKWVGDASLERHTPMSSRPLRNLLCPRRVSHASFCLLILVTLLG